jgi:Zn-finger nucleic acid-binding protein
MKCPRCESVVLDERTRDGIQIDACPTCRGVWLDRGELERLVAAATRAVDAEIAARTGTVPTPHHVPNHAPHARPPRRDDDDDDDDRYSRDDHRRPGDRGEPPRRRRWLEVFDIFD